MSARLRGLAKHILATGNADREHSKLAKTEVSQRHMTPTDHPQRIKLRMQDNNTKLFAWIKKLPAEDRAWARSYLQKKGLIIGYQDFETPCNKIWTSDAQTREFDHHLRNAWRQRKTRKGRTGKKAYSFVLTNRSKLKLDRIAEEMHSSITDALINVIEHEDRRIEEHKQALKDTKNYVKQTNERHKKEKEQILETNMGIITVLRKLEDTLNLQTMQLALMTLQSQNIATLHTPLERLKDHVIEEFSRLHSEIEKSIGLISLGLPTRENDTEKLWRKLLATHKHTNPT